MSRKPRPDDVRVEVSRYRIGRLTEEIDGSTAPEQPDDDADAGQVSMDRRAQFVELTIQEAIRRGDFDDLPGAGRPLEGLDGVHDPDWWIRRKIEREKLTGLGPPALTLRTENAALDARLDALHTEDAVREVLQDFNARVIEARRQLQGGPPVVTPTREIEVEIAKWRSRKDERRLQDALVQAERERALAALGRGDRRRLRKQARQATRAARRGLR